MALDSNQQKHGISGAEFQDHINTPRLQTGQGLSELRTPDPNPGLMEDHIGSISFLRGFS